MSDTPKMAGWWQASDGKWYPPEQHPGRQWAPRKKPPKPGPWRRFRGLPLWVQVAAWVALVILVAGIAGSGSDDDGERVTSGTGGTSPAPNPASTAVATVAPPPTQATTPPAPTTRAAPTTIGPRTSFSDGTYRVGVDIEPGTYRTAGPVAGRPTCYWARLSDLSGGFDAIIANENVRGQGVVTIAASDAGFRTNGCQRWERTG